MVSENSVSFVYLCRIYVDHFIKVSLDCIVLQKNIQQIVHKVRSLVEVAVELFENERDACGDRVVPAVQFHDVAGRRPNC